MFYILFGSVWTIIVGIMTFMCYFVPGNINVNGEIVSHDEFVSMLGPKIFLGFFLLIGIIMLLIGIRQVVRNIKTSKLGENCYGKLLEIYPSGTYINGRPELKADFALYIPSTNSVEVKAEVIGMNSYKFQKGTYYNIKYYNNDINVGEMIDEVNVPPYISDMINYEYKTEIHEEKIIEINGEKYMKIDN